MSDRDRKQSAFTEWGEQPKARSGASERPLGAGMSSGEIRIKGSESEKTAQFSEETINQLALALARGVS